MAATSVNGSGGKEGQDPLRARILTAATELFSEKGVNATSLREIADRVGVTKGGIYHYFPSKDELHASIHLYRIDAALEELEEVTSSGLSSEQKVRKLIWIMLNSIATHREEFTVMLREGVADRPLHWQILAEKRERYQVLVRGVLEGGVEAGEFEIADPRLGALALIGMCNWSYTWIEANNDTPIEQVAELFSDMLLTGMVVDAKSRSGTVPHS
jgi:TetR/AcrR family transcriptional regulator, cholesterol catabolism regulator